MDNSIINYFYTLCFILDRIYNKDNPPPKKLLYALVKHRISLQSLSHPYTTLPYLFKNAQYAAQRSYITTLLDLNLQSFFFSITIPKHRIIDSPHYQYSRVALVYHIYAGLLPSFDTVSITIGPSSHRA